MMTKDETAAMLDSAFAATVERIFSGWMAGQGYVSDLIPEEFARLRAVAGDDAAYLRVQRTGSKFPLERHTKLVLAALYRNAVDMAVFEIAARRRRDLQQARVDRILDGVRSRMVAA